MKYETLRNRLIDGKGWIDATHVYGSATRIDISDGIDYTGLIPTGAKITWMEGASQKFGYITGSAYSTNTQLTILGSTVVNTTITDVYISSSASLINHPQWIDYTPTFGGLTGAPSGVFQFMIIDDTCFVYIRTTTGTSNATTFTVTASIAARNTTDMIQGDTWWEGRDNNVLQANNGRWFMSPNSATITIDKDCAGAAWTNSGTKRIGLLAKFRYQGT